ncbi:DUF1223 domain-containing protein [Nitrospirillum bahiense]|uniref:Secreted protein n=1 Tax=Nitrospirillum amazonense TaxID=28077 RepID=A0A560F6F7_9PROT|nr:DUF1223 domain-containing protein [Nitrospirillum amazonense]TWB17104.1 hypothetical protein FBZ88_12631 [Nitrospirillum amazonense]
MRRTGLLLLAFGLGLPISTPALAAGPVVVELFTSQGCSSCPPADAFLTNLAQDRRDVLPLAFHVTYWNGLGWRDPYSLEAATARQRWYARSLGGGQVYTPEMVVNGERAFVGSDRARGLAEIADATRRQAAPVGLQVARGEDGLVISVGAGKGQQGDILVVGYDPQHRTLIGRGENSGRTLLESNIVRSLTPAGQWRGDAVEVRQPLPAGERVAVLLQAPDGRILSAAILSQAPGDQTPG